MKVQKLLKLVKSKIFWLIFLFVLIGGYGWWGWYQTGEMGSENVNPLSGKIVERRPEFYEYRFPQLVKREDEASEVVREEVIEEDEERVVKLFSYESEGKRITGQMKVPKGKMPEGGWPTIVMLRGWIDPENYETGGGTRNGADYYVREGFATFAPDFLGYGGSDEPMENTFGARLQKPVSVLDLLASLKKDEIVDEENVFIWGHSNGGQIGLSVLEILGKRGEGIPAAFWAPVSKPFPYSILYYTDESEDKGKELRRVLAEFEREHDVMFYSVDEYFSWINSPLQIHQGTADGAVPKEWSDELVERLEDESELGEDGLSYYVYPGADHNLKPSWETVVGRDVEFFRSFLE